MTTSKIEAFVRESNKIEGITRDPFEHEIVASEIFLRLTALHRDALNELQRAFAPGKPIRDRQGLNVYVGNHVPPPGGPEIPIMLDDILARANRRENPWKVHIAYETLHPYLDGNGRTGRMIWAWQMMDIGRDPFALGFLHSWYYQTLQNVRAE